MLWVVDKKVVKHALNVGVALVEVPIRIRFEFGLDEGRFVPKSMQRDVLFNGKELLRRFPRLQAGTLDVEIERVVDRTLVEHLKFSGYAQGDVALYAGTDEQEEDERPRPAPTIVAARSLRDYKAADAEQ